MQTSPAGRAAIARREGNVLKAYPDPATGGEPYTIGVGHTSAAGPPTVTPGMTITAAESDAILARDLGATQRGVWKAVRVKLTQNQFDALVSLAFNIGVGAFARSTLCRKLNAGDYEGAAQQFRVWNKANGKVMNGLVKRRADETKQFRTPDAPDPFEAPAEPAEPQVVAQVAIPPQTEPVAAKVPEQDAAVVVAVPQSSNGATPAATIAHPAAWGTAAALLSSIAALVGKHFGAW